MWHSKYKAVKYLGVAFTSSFGAYVGVRHFLSVRDLKAEIRADNAKDEVRFQYYIKLLVPLLSNQSSLISKIKFCIQIFPEICRDSRCGSDGAWYCLSFSRTGI